MSALEQTLVYQMLAVKLPQPEREYRFHPKRRWRFDFAYPALKLAIEIEGGTYTNGRHVRPAGFRKDCEKYNAAALAGWRVLRFPGEMIKSGEALNTIESAVLEGLKS